MLTTLRSPPKARAKSRGPDGRPEPGWSSHGEERSTQRRRRGPEPVKWSHTGAEAPQATGLFSPAEDVSRERLSLWTLGRREEAGGTAPAGLHGAAEVGTTSAAGTQDASRGAGSGTGACAALSRGPASRTRDLKSSTARPPGANKRALAWRGGIRHCSRLSQTQLGCSLHGRVRDASAGVKRLQAPGGAETKLPSGSCWPVLAKGHSVSGCITGFGLPPSTRKNPSARLTERLVTR